MRVYLSGTITSDASTHEWREWLKGVLEEQGHKVYTPMRGKSIKSISEEGFKSDIAPSLFVTRDLNDIRASNVLVVYFPTGICDDRQSIGTWSEFGLAIELRIPIIVISDDPLVARNPFVEVCSAAVVETLEQAVETIAWLDNS